MSFISAGNTTTTTLVVNGDTTGNLIFATGGANTTALTLSNAQNATFPGSVSSVNTFGYKNKLINGDFRVWQRGTSVTPALGSLTQYVSDRWASYQTGAAVAVSQTAASFNGYQYCAVWNGTASNTEVSMFQCVESVNAYQLYGSYATFSAWIYSSVAKTVTMSIGYANSANNFSSVTSVYSQAFSHPGTGWVQYSLTSSATLSSSFGNGIRVLITFPNCTTGTFAITGVQLEAGTQTTGFDFRDYGQELLMCQRYYQFKSVKGEPGPAATSISAGCVSLSAPMRTDPSVAYYDLSGNASRITTQASGANQTMSGPPYTWGVDYSTMWYDFSTGSSMGFWWASTWTLSAEL